MMAILQLSDDANLQLFSWLMFYSCWWSTAVVAAYLSTYGERDLSMSHISSITQRKFWMHWLTYTTRMWCIRIWGSVVLVHVMGKIWPLDGTRKNLIKIISFQDFVKLMWLKNKLKTHFNHIYMNSDYYLLSHKHFLLFTCRYI